MYTPLKITTDYSILKSLIKIDDLITFLHTNKINSCAIVDDNLSGSIEFYLKCKKHNIKPIIGLEITVDNNVIYLYAKNYDGYINLLKINTLKEQGSLSIVSLQKYKDDLLVIVPYEYNEFLKYIEFYDDIYLGYSSKEELINSKLVTKNVVYINDIKCFNKEDLKYLKYLDLINDIQDSKYNNNYYIKDNELVDNNVIDEIINKIDLIIPMNNRYIPKYNNSSSKFLHDLAYKGLKKRLNNRISEDYIKRLDYELDVINKMGFVDYFLIVYDYVLYAKKNNILVGPGRGSAAGSLVSYSIGITEIDPIKYNLLFERFLNPERITMPDIDIDFDADKRYLVIDYVKEKYGINKVALGLTYNTLKAKLVLREVGKILKIDLKLLDNFIKCIDEHKSLKDNLKIVNVKKYLDNYKELKELYKISLKLENIKKNTSIHASGVVISSIDLDDVIPIHIDNEQVITGITMEYLETMGLLKMDFLALKNLTTIANIIDKIKINNLNNINLEDRKVFEVFNTGNVDGVFQFETPVMRNFLTKFKINSFNDLVASLALVRPGPKDYIDLYLRRKEGKEKIIYLHPDLEDILKETNGILLYQEQIMAILAKIGGYSLGEADIIRRAISKKKEDIINEEQYKFIDRAISNGYEKDIALKIYEQIAKFASYGFNKSHSVAYAHISYQMAYLKAYYPDYFLLEDLNNIKSLNQNKIVLIKRQGIKINKPSVLNKNTNYEINNNELYLPLSIIKLINNEVSKRIIENDYKDIFDFFSLNYDNLSKDQFINLIHGGALDSFKYNHQTLIYNLENILNYASLSSNAGDLIEKPSLDIKEEYSDEVLRDKELEVCGIYLTNHPCSKYPAKEYMKLANASKYCFKKVKCAVLIDSIKGIKTKNNEDMAFIKASDETDSLEFTLFPKNIDLIKKLEKNKVVIIIGEVSKRFDKYQIIVNNILESGDKSA